MIVKKVDTAQYEIISHNNVYTQKERDKAQSN